MTLHQLVDYFFEGVMFMSNDAANFATHLLEDAFEKNASDIHFHPLPDLDYVAIFYRQLGERKYIRDITKAFYQNLLMYFKFSANMDIGETRSSQNGMLHWFAEGELYHLRFSTLPVGYAESLTIRIFPQSQTPKLEELLLFPPQYHRLRHWLNYDTGIILFTGPTGSGKSTTMYSMLEELVERHAAQVITLEEPIERQIDHVLQVEVNEKAGMTYQAGLKAALRHDPDVILIGEIRDEKTASFAVRASLTGHLVLTTLHAKNAFGTINRLIDLGINRIDLHQSLIGVASLELLPIITKGKMQRRAGIVELLDGLTLEKAILHDELDEAAFQSFEYLKRKALRYGFITEEIYQKTTKG